MKELNKKVRDRVEVSTQAQEERELELIKTLIPHNGHTLFEVNRKTLEIKEAEYTYQKTFKLRVSWKSGDKIAGGRSLIVNPDCEYVLALNKKSAIKKFKENRDGSRYKTNGNIKFY